MSPATWHEAEKQGTQHAKQSLPVTGALWLTLLKFSSGEWNVSTAERDVLLAYGLVCKEEDTTVLTSYGRQVLERSS